MPCPLAAAGPTIRRCVKKRMEQETDYDAKRQTGEYGSGFEKGSGAD